MAGKKRARRSSSYRNSIRGGAIDPQVIYEAHKGLQEVKPFSRAMAITKPLGINRFVSKNLKKSKVGRKVLKGINKVGSVFKKLGYGYGGAAGARIMGNLYRAGMKRGMQFRRGMQKKMLRLRG